MKSKTNLNLTPSFGLFLTNNNLIKEVTTMAKNKIALEYTDTAELQAKRDKAVREANDNADKAYNKCKDKFKQLLNKSNVKFHSIEICRSATSNIHQEIMNAEFLKKYGPDGKLFKISNKKTKKFNYELTRDYDWDSRDYKMTYVQEEAIDWYLDRIEEDYKRAEKFLNRKSVKNIIAEIKAIYDNKETIIARYDAQIEKAQQIQQICADYKDLDEFVRAVNEEAKKLGYYACLNKHSFEFHKSLEHGRYSYSITAYATLPYSRKKEDECIIFTNELLEQVMQPLHDALKVDNSWEDKYKDVFYINKMKTKVNVHVLSGTNRYYRHPAKEFSIKNFNEVNFKNWLKNAKVSEYSHLSNEVLKKARSV